VYQLVSKGLRYVQLFVEVCVWKRNSWWWLDSL